MSLMKETINNNVVDNYEEHSQHLVVDNNCSTCYNNPPQVMTNDEGYIVNDDRPVVTEDEWEECKQDKLLEESEQAQKEN